MSSAIARHRRRVEAGYARLPDNGGAVGRESVQ
jgi:hypothetical protein